MRCQGTDWEGGLGARKWGRDDSSHADVRWCWGEPPPEEKVHQRIRFYKNSVAHFLKGMMLAPAGLEVWCFWEAVLDKFQHINWFLQVTILRSASRENYSHCHLWSPGNGPSAIVEAFWTPLLIPFYRWRNWGIETKPGSQSHRAHEGKYRVRGLVPGSEHWPPWLYCLNTYWNPEGCHMQEELPSFIALSHQPCCLHPSKHLRTSSFTSWFKFFCWRYRISK